jgi:hypothetical protein
MSGCQAENLQIQPQIEKQNITWFLVPRLPDTTLYHLINTQLTKQKDVAFYLEGVKLKNSVLVGPAYTIKLSSDAIKLVVAQLIGHRR